MSHAVNLLRELVELKHIKIRMQTGLASLEEITRYETTKEGIWQEAERYLRQNDILGRRRSKVKNSP